MKGHRHTHHRGLALAGRIIITTLTVLLGGGLFAGAPAQAANELSLPTNTVITALPGSIIELGRAPVDTDLAGPLCTWEATITNQESVNPGNDIIIRSGQSELVLTGVEDARDKVTTASGSAYLSSEIVVLLRMGQNEVFSGGLDISIRYQSCPPVPTTTATTATTAAPEVTQAAVPPTTATTTTATTTTATTTTATNPAITQPLVTTSDVAAVTTVVAHGATLPRTGGNSPAPLLGVGAALIALGTLLTVRVHHRPRQI